MNSVVSLKFSFILSVIILLTAKATAVAANPLAEQAYLERERLSALHASGLFPDGAKQRRKGDVGAPQAIESITGTLTLPGGVPAPGFGYGFAVFVRTYDAQGNQLFFDPSPFPASVFVPGGSSSAGFTVDYAEAPVDGFYDVLVVCALDCGDIVTANTYINESGDVFYSHTLIAKANLPATLEFELETGVAITLQAVMPEGLVANETDLLAFSYVDVTSRDLSANFTSYAFERLFFQEGDALADSARIVLPVISEGTYEIRYYHENFNDVNGCCRLVTRALGYSSTGQMRPSLLAERFPNLPESVQLPFFEATKGTFRLSRSPNRPELTKELFFEIHLNAFDSEDNQLSDDIAFEFLFGGETIKNEEFEFIKLPVGGYYRIDYTCWDDQAYDNASDCSPFEETNPAYIFDVPEADLDDPILLELVELITADEFEEDDFPIDAKPISIGEVQTRSIEANNESDWATFTLSQATDVEILARAARRNTAPRMYLAQAGDLTDVEDAADVLDDDELENMELAAIRVPSLPAGDYVIRVRGTTDITILSSYTLSLNPPSDDEELCFPIPAKRDRFAIVCL